MNSDAANKITSQLAAAANNMRNVASSLGNETSPQGVTASQAAAHAAKAISGAQAAFEPFLELVGSPGYVDPNPPSTS